MQLDFTLHYENNLWICTKESLRFVADNLNELDATIETYLKKKYKTGEHTIKMFFDFDSFPHWHRQYMPHYFNREIHFSLTNQPEL